MSTCSKVFLLFEGYAMHYSTVAYIMIMLTQNPPQRKLCNMKVNLTGIATILFLTDLKGTSIAPNQLCFKILLKRSATDGLLLNLLICPC